MPSFVQIQFGLLGTLLAVLVGVGLVQWARSRPWGRESRSDLWQMAVCFLIALAARLAATPFPADMKLASSQGVFLHTHWWSAAYSALLHGLFLVFPSNVASVAGMNVVLGALTASVLFALVVALFQDRLAAFAAGIAFALQPLSVRYAASDSAHILVTFSLLLSLLLAVRWNQRDRRSLLFQAVGWAAVAANTRPEALVVPAALVIVLIGVIDRLDGRRLISLGISGLGGALLLVQPAASSLGWSPDPSLVSPLGIVEALFHSQHSPLAITGFCLAGVVVALVRHPRAAGGYLLALWLVALPTGNVRVEDAEFNHRHVVPNLGMWCAFAGIGIGATFEAIRRVAAKRLPSLPTGPVLVRVAIVLLVAATAFPHRGFLTKMWTYALEYRFIVEHLGDIPDDCLMIVPVTGEQHDGLGISWEISAEVGRRHRWIRIPELHEAPDADCTVYYRAAACVTWEEGEKFWSGPERPDCAKMWEHFDLLPIAGAEIPAIPYSAELYGTDPIWIGFYRATPRARSP